jgi:4-oxalocrotonate tautomerase
MPHIVVKLWPGQSEAQKTRLAEAITKDVTSILHTGEASVSVGFEEVPPKDWKEKVFKRDIQAHWNQLYKKPGHGENDI